MHGDLGASGLVAGTLAGVGCQRLRYPGPGLDAAAFRMVSSASMEAMIA